MSRLDKRVENRSWNSTFRGPFAIHLALGCSDDEVEICRTFLRARDLLAGFDNYHDGFRRRGGVVALSAVLDVVAPRQKDGEKRFEQLGIDPRWWMRDKYGYALAPIKPVDPIPCKGKTNFFPLSESPEILAELERRLLMLWEKPALQGDYCASCAGFSLRGIICIACGSTLCPDCENMHPDCPDLPYLSGTRRLA